MEDNYYVDTGIYYADREMVSRELVMSMNTALVYDISSPCDIKIIKKASDTFYAIAQKDIKDDGPCFYGGAAIYREVPKNGSEAGKLNWEL